MPPGGNMGAIAGATQMPHPWRTGGQPSYQTKGPRASPAGLAIAMSTDALEGRSSTGVAATMRVVTVSSAGRSAGNACKNRQGEQGGKDGLHDHSPGFCVWPRSMFCLHLSASSSITREPDMARIAPQKRRPHAPVTNSDDFETKRGHLRCSRWLGCQSASATALISATLPTIAPTCRPPPPAECGSAARAGPPADRPTHERLTPNPHDAAVPCSSMVCLPRRHAVAGSIRQLIGAEWCHRADRGNGLDHVAQAQGHKAQRQQVAVYAECVARHIFCG